MTPVAVERWTWDLDAFLRAETAGLFGDRHVELVNGEVRAVVHGHWHGRVTANVTQVLANAYRGGAWRATSETLVLGEHAPDPDCWIIRRVAQPQSEAGRLAIYDPADVLLVVEVADATERDDLSTMADLYARAGIAHYWVVSRSGVHVHRGPTPAGYRTRELFDDSTTVTPPQTDTDTAIAVADLLDTQ